MAPRYWIVLVGATLAAVGLGRLWLAHHRAERLAKRVNRGLVPHRLPAVEGPLRESTCGGLLGAALGDSRGFVPRSWRSNAVPPHPYSVATQVMLASARALRPDGQVNRHQYLLEMGYLARYARGGARLLRRTLRRLRKSIRSTGDPRSRDADALLAAIPVGLVWHHRPRRAAAVASEVIHITHRAREVRECAAVVAAAVALSIRRRDREPVEILARRAWLERVVDSAGGDDNTAALRLLTVADLAAREPEEAAPHLTRRGDAVSALESGLYVALRNSDSPSAALDSLARLGSSRVAGAIALGLIGVRVGHAGLPAELLAALEDGEQIEAWGEKLALLAPDDVEPSRGPLSK